jgi:hypothetical protein
MQQFSRAKPRTRLRNRVPRRPPPKILSIALSEPSSRPSTPPARPAPPTPSAAVTQQLVASLRAQAASGPFLLSPSEPGIKDRGYLDWFYPANVDGQIGNQSSRFDPGQGHLIIGINCAPNSRYLITCGIWGYTSNPQSFTINRLDHPDADPPLGSVSITDKEHLICAVQVVGGGWNGFTISSKGGFMFYWCQITPLA